MSRSRWTSAALWAFAVFSAFVAQLVVGLVMLSPRSPANYLVIAAITAAALGIAIPILYAPVVMVVTRLRPGISTVSRGVLGAAFFPFPQLMLALLFSERADTWQSMIAHVLRLPGEMLISGVPLAFGGFIFCSLLVHPRGRRVV